MEHCVQHVGLRRLPRRRLLVFPCPLARQYSLLIAVQRRHARQMVEKSHLTSGRRRHPHPLARALAVIRRTSHHRRGARRLPRTDGHHLHEHRLLVPPQQQRSHRRRLEQPNPRSHLEQRGVGTFGRLLPGVHDPLHEQSARCGRISRSRPCRLRLVVRSFALSLPHSARCAPFPRLHWRQ